MKLPWSSTSCLEKVVVSVLRLQRPKYILAAIFPYSIVLDWVQVNKKMHLLLKVAYMYFRLANSHSRRWAGITFRTFGFSINFRLDCIVQNMLQCLHQMHAEFSVSMRKNLHETPIQFRDPHRKCWSRALLEETWRSKSFRNFPSMCFTITVHIIAVNCSIRCYWPRDWLQRSLHIVTK